jgi:hypothetical protein
VGTQFPDAPALEKYKTMLNFTLSAGDAERPKIAFPRRAWERVANV